MKRQCSHHPHGQASIQLKNIMCTVNLGCRINLPLLARKFNNGGVEFNPVKYNPVVIRIKNPKSTFNIFASGKLICTGTRSINDAKKVTRRISQLISECTANPLVKYDNFRILNLVYSGSVRKKINLNNIYYKFDKCIYEPELFPGMKIPIPVCKNTSNVVALLFNSGKIIITGLKEKEDAILSYNYVSSKL